jgi:hypothetical protein
MEVSQRNKETASSTFGAFIGKRTRNEIGVFSWLVP